MSRLLYLICILVVLVCIITLRDSAILSFSAERLVTPVSYVGTSAPLLEVTSSLSEGLLDESSIAVFQSAYNAAKTVNSDVIGWIYFPSLDISYPVLHSDSNKTYLRTSFTGEYDVNGSIYLDSSLNLGSAIKLIHGHNMLDGRMFARLPELLQYQNLDSLLPVYFYDGSILKVFKVFSVYSLDTRQTDFHIPEILTLNDVNEQQFVLWQQSLVPSTEPADSFELLMLNTCWYGESGQEHGLHCIVVAFRME